MVKRLVFTEDTNKDFASYPFYATKIGNTYVRCDGTNIQRSTDRESWTTTLANVVSVVRVINHGGEDRVYVVYIGESGGNYFLTIQYANETDLLADSWTSDSATGGEWGYISILVTSKAIDVFKANSVLYIVAITPFGANANLGFYLPEASFAAAGSLLFLNGNYAAPGYVKDDIYYFITDALGPV